MSRLLSLYPAPWRERYEAEMQELLTARPPTLAERLDLFGGALDAWIHPQVRRRPGDAARDDPGPRLTTAVAILGGVLFAVSGVAVASSRAIGPDGYQDNGAAVPLLIAGMLLTAIATLLLATERTPKRTAAVMVGGSLLTLLSWPILIVGFFTYIGATIALGAQLLARGQLAGLALIAIGLILPSFNTETDLALAGVPVGILWIAFAFAVWRSGAPSAPTAPVRRADRGGAGG